MKKLSCNIGDVFGEFTVIDNTPITVKGHTCVKVKCSCEREYLRNLGDLIKGRTSKCKSCSAKYRKISINIGDVYKNWTVIQEIRKGKKLMYKCKCKCGIEINFVAAELIAKNRNYSCLKCAQMERGIKDRIQNGQVGNLTLTKYGKIKRTAESRGINFLVTLEYLWELFELQNSKCAITGDFISDINKASLDRINSNLPYIDGNVQWVTTQANLSKHVMSTKELIEFCKKVLNHANQQPSET